MLERPKLRQDQAVIVRVWKSRVAGGAGVGHASIDIPSFPLYISVWPGPRVKSKSLAGVFSPITPAFHTFEEDIVAEGKDGKVRHPEITIALYSLNLGAIEAAYGRKKEKLEKEGGWQLIRGTLFPAAGESCAFVVYSLLNAGGIYDLVAGAYSSSFSSVAAPDVLVTFTKAAKKRELAEYPETADLHFAGETEMEAVGRKCSIM